MVAFFATALVSVTAWGQLLTEDFNYTDGALLTANGWTAFSGGGTNAITVHTTSALTYSGYTGSGIGNGVSLTTSGEDDRKGLSSAITSGTLYLSALVNVSAAQTTGDYFLSPYCSSGTGGGYFGRIFIKSTTGGFYFGVSKNTTSPNYESTVRSLSTTYLIVLKYTIVGSNASGTTDDQVDFFVNPTISASEPTPTISVIAVEQDIYGTAGFDNVALRQGAAANTPTMNVDGIRVATTWGGIPLPVELTSFTALAGKNSVELAWNTATEVNDYGFDIERAIHSGLNGLRDWAKVGFVSGNGTSNAPHSYSFADNSVMFGTYSYRLKQIDRNGNFEYSKEVEAAVTMTPNTILLGQNYPNPFNPETNIEFAVPISGYTTLKVYNTLGEEITTLVNGNIEAGVLHQVTFKGSNFPSGMYFYTLRSGNFVETKKMLMVK